MYEDNNNNNNSPFDFKFFTHLLGGKKAAEISMNLSSYACTVLWRYFKSLSLRNKRDMHLVLHSLHVYIKFSINISFFFS